MVRKPSNHFTFSLYIKKEVLGISLGIVTIKSQNNKKNPKTIDKIPKF